MGWLEVGSADAIREVMLIRGKAEKAIEEYARQLRYLLSWLNSYLGEVKAEVAVH